MYSIRDRIFAVVRKISLLLYCSVLALCLGAFIETPTVSAQDLVESRVTRESTVRFQIQQIATESRTGAPRIFSAETNRLYIDGQLIGSASGKTIVDIVQSRSGLYRAMLSCDQSPGTAACFVDTFDDDGVQNSIPIPYASDTPYPVLAISDTDGSIAFGQPATGRVDILMADGETAFSSEPRGTEFDIERSMMLDWNQDGDRLLVVRELDAPGTRARPENILLQVLTPLGREIFVQTVSGRALSAARFSESGRLAVVSAHDIWTGTQNTTTFGLDNQTRVQVPFMAEQIYIDDAERSILLSNKHDLLVTGVDGSIRYNMKTVDQPRVILDSRLSPDGRTVSFINTRPGYRPGGFVFSDSELGLIDIDTAITRSIAIPGESRQVLLQATERGAVAVSDREVTTMRFTDDG